MVLSKVKEIVAGQLAIDESLIEMDTELLRELEGDSLDAVEIIMAIEDEFGVTIPDEILEKVVTVQDAYDLVKTIG